MAAAEAVRGVEIIVLKLRAVMVGELGLILQAMAGQVVQLELLELLGLVVLSVLAAAVAEAEM